MNRNIVTHRKTALCLPGLIALILGAGVFSSSGLFAAESELPEKLKAAPANEWIKLYERNTGGRQSPIWYYDTQIGKFVLTGGAFGWPVHWDNEEFDLATGKMINAYPAGLPEGHGKPAAGPTQYPYPPKQGHGESGRWRKDKNGLLRLPTFAGYGNSSQAYHQYAYDPEAKRVVLYCLNQTMAYDPQSRTWSNTGAGAFSKGHHMKWGSMGYDPVNKEIVSIGGSSFEAGGTPGTWVFTCATNKWEKLHAGSAAMRELNAEARQVEREGWDFLSALRNRFYRTESEAEAGAKLSERGQALADSLGKLAAAIEDAQLDDVEKPAAERAAKKVAEVLETIGGLQDKFDIAVDSPLLAAMQQVHMKLDAAEHNLDFEPAARAMSQMTYDPVNQVLVLFGGSEEESRAPRGPRPALAAEERDRLAGRRLHVARRPELHVPGRLLASALGGLDLQRREERLEVHLPRSAAQDSPRTWPRFQ